MKKLLLLSLLSFNAFAATSGTLLLQGIVLKKLDILVTPTPVASALNLEVSQTDLKVATVNEKSNSKTGYKVTITSANLGKLKRTDGPEVFNYTLKYANTPVLLSSSAGTVFSNASMSVVNINKDLNISYTGALNQTMIEGTYADTLTLTIASN